MVILKLLSLCYLADDCMGVIIWLQLSVCYLPVNFTRLWLSCCSYLSAICLAVLSLLTPRDYGFILSENHVIEEILIFFVANI